MIPRVISNETVVKPSTCSGISIVQFLDSKLIKVNPFKKRRSRKSVSKVVSRKAITEDETLKKVCECEKMKKPKINPNNNGKKANDKRVKKGYQRKE